MSENVVQVECGGKRYTIEIESMAQVVRIDRWTHGEIKDGRVRLEGRIIKEEEPNA